MDEKIKLKAVERYSEEFAGRLTDRAFSTRNVISGSEILQLSDIKQINLFVLHRLFQVWKAENKKIQSPYFDYSAPLVKEALDSLMNTLSNHIAVSREHFTPLLNQAVYDTLLLILDPYDFFSDLIAGENQSLDVRSFREQLKYLKVNRAPLERLLEKLEAKQVDSISGNEAFAMLDQILEEVNFTPEDVEGYIEAFSRTLPLNVASFYENVGNEIEHKERQEETPVSSSVTSAQETPKQVQSSPAVNQPKVNIVFQQTTRTTINEKLSQAPRPTVGENFKKIAKIKDSLTINQKFMFTKVLFHGDFELFSKAVDDLDRQDSLQGALKYLEMNYDEWDRDSEEFHEFMELLEKRFA